jgi:Ser-tRNA(Ala) deacylase AlaX
MTEKLYWELPYETTFKAKVVGLSSDGVILDKTLFYPQGGGQESDKGKLEKEGLYFEVKSVSKEGEAIIHHISSDLTNKIQVGDLISGEIDWNYRYGVMRAHSSQHILSALIKNKFNIDTAHATISFEDVSLQIARDISDIQFEEILNEFVRICTVENHEFHTNLISRDEIKSIKDRVRGKVPNEGKVRLVELKKYDLICCGGTHVKNSTEIGPIFIYEFSKGKNFKYKVGLSAVNQFTSDNIDILNYARTLNLPATILIRNFQKQLDKKLIFQQNYINLATTALKLVSQHPNTKINNVKVGLLEIDLDYKLIQKQFKEFPEEYLLILKEESNKIHLLSNSDRAQANKILEHLLKKYGGKGGGSPYSAQGTLNNVPTNIISELSF